MQIPQLCGCAWSKSAVSPGVSHVIRVARFRSQEAGQDTQLQHIQSASPDNACWCRLDAILTNFISHQRDITSPVGSQCRTFGFSGHTRQGLGRQPGQVTDLEEKTRFRQKRHEKLEKQVAGYFNILTSNTDIRGRFSTYPTMTCRTLICIPYLSTSYVLRHL